MCDRTVKRYKVVNTLIAKISDRISADVVEKISDIGSAAKNRIG